MARRSRLARVEGALYPAALNNTNAYEIANAGARMPAHAALERRGQYRHSVVAEARKHRR
jgi:hypothetical protein